jgi:hypothetical protein
LAPFPAVFSGTHQIRLTNSMFNQLGSPTTYHRFL